MYMYIKLCTYLCITDLYSMHGTYICMHNTYICIHVLVHTETLGLSMEIYQEKIYI